MFLSPHDISALNILRSSITSGKSLSEILTDCHIVSQKISDPIFPFIYVAILFATDGKNNEAIEALWHANCSAFAKTLRAYLIEHKKFEPNNKVFDTTTPYRVWTETESYQKYLSNSLAAICNFSQRVKPFSREVTIFDIGSGNGVFIRHVIHNLAKLHHLSKVVLIINDASAQMLRTTKIHVPSHTVIPVHIVAIEGRIENLGDKELKPLKEHGPIWFINAAASIHHMPKETKILLLEKLGKYVHDILISDFHADNDLPDQNTPEFVYSVTTQLYDFFIDDVLQSKATNQDKKICIEQFMLAEAINMLKKPRETRIDYHATINQWKDIAQKSGFSVLDTAITLADKKNVPKTFTMHTQQRS